MGDDRVSGNLRDAVDETIVALPTEKADSALIAYVEALADEIDERERVATYAAAAIRKYDEDPERYGVEIGEALGALRAKLSARDTLDRLGARLHAALVELGASPRARAKGEAPKAAPVGSSALSLMRGGASA